MEQTGVRMLLRSLAGGSRSTCAVGLLLIGSLIGVAPCAGQEATENEQAMAAYADAANFQTNGAIELAIAAWKKYLESYPDEPLVAKAWHYLGVCYMQQAEPDYVLAAEAFAHAIKDPQSDLREESLVNLGWCQFAAAGQQEPSDEQRLKEALSAFRTLIKERPSSKYLDRALFYAGESAYALGQPREAVAYYDRLLALEASKESPLRCDTFYARGIALEDLQRYDDAMASYRQLLEGCKDDRLIIDARIRMGDASITHNRFDEAITQFAEVAKVDGPDRPYALLRQAFALVQADRSGEAAAVYERLVQDFPDSPYAAAAVLASAQAAYRAGDLAAAAKRFERVLEQNDPAAATEAAHWLAMIALRNGDPAAAAATAQRQIDAGPTGPYAATLRMDLAEATMLLPGKTAEAMQLFRSLYTSNPQAPEAPRAFYNAAFAAMQLGQYDQAVQWTGEFQTQFPSDPLLADVQYIRAESQLMSGAAGEAAEVYLRLLDEPASAEKVQRPLWLLRAATALSVAGQHDAAIELLEKNRSGFTDPNQQAEANYLIGTIHLGQGRGEAATEALKQALAAAPDWPRAEEANLQLGQAHLLAGDTEQAAEVWEGIVKRAANSPRGDQALYRLAQLSARAGDHQQAAARFEQLLQSNRDPLLTPFALYGRGWNLMRSDQPAEALAALDRLLEQHAEHPIVSDAKLARGMCLRALDQPDAAAEVLQAYLASDPQGANLGHALYELALIDQDQDRPAEAAKRLEQLVAAVPNYPLLEKVLYEWAWSLKESGQDDAAQQRFQQLIDQYPQDPLAAEAYYFIGQRHYGEEAWETAAEHYAAAAAAAPAAELREKSLYRQGWSYYQAADFERAVEVFAAQAQEFPEGQFLPDALLMIGEGYFRQAKYEPAAEAYRVARERIEKQNETQQQFTSVADRQIRELVFLHGGQSLAQLKQYEAAKGWFEELEKRFPDSQYLPQARYETAFALQQLGQDDEALKLYEEVAAEQRNELGARARFMMGEIYFGRRDLVKAIPEFQRVMYGYGAERAPEAVRNWQAKSGYEAGRCAELMIEQASTPERRQKSAEIAAQFFQYVVDKHPKHELAAKGQERLEALKRQAAEASQPANQNPLRTRR